MNREPWWAELGAVLIVGAVGLVFASVAVGVSVAIIIKTVQFLGMGGCSGY